MTWRAVIGGNCWLLFSVCSAMEKEDRNYPYLKSEWDETLNFNISRKFRPPHTHAAGEEFLAGKFGTSLVPAVIRPGGERLRPTADYLTSFISSLSDLGYRLSPTGCSVASVRVNAQKSRGSAVVIALPGVSW